MIVSSSQPLLLGALIDDLGASSPTLDASERQECLLRIHRRGGLSPPMITRRRCRVYEMPVSYDGRDYREGKKIGWKDGVQALYYIRRYALAD